MQSVGGLPSELCLPVVLTESLQHKPLILSLEPLDSILLRNGLKLANTSARAATLGYPIASTLEHNVKVHTIDTRGGIVLKTEIDMLVDAKPEAARTTPIGTTAAAEVSLLQLKLLYLETALENLLGLRAADGDMGGNLFITTDTECTDGETGLGEDGGLPGKLLKHATGTSQTIARLAYANIEHELVDLQLTHRVCCILLSHFESGLGDLREDVMEG